jgi:hypothetical protein
MARLFTWNEIKKNGAVYTAPVEKLLNSKRVVILQTVNDNFTGATESYSLLNYKANDDANPDQRYSEDPASDVLLAMNDPNTTNNIEAIILSVIPDNGVAAYDKVFNPRYIHEVGDWIDNPLQAYLMYEEPEAQDAVITTYHVDSDQAAIKAAANS